MFALQTIFVFMALCSKYASMAACALHVFTIEWVVCLICRSSLMFISLCIDCACAMRLAYVSATSAAPSSGISG